MGLARVDSIVILGISMRRRHAQRGLSLLEVILAIAILGGALATIGQLIRVGARNAAQARDLTMAQLYAESQMNRLAAGVELLDSVTDSPYDDAGLYTYSVDVTSTERMGVMAATVTVKQSPGTAVVPVSYVLSRWIVDPEYAQTLAEQEAAMKQAFADAQAAAAESSGTASEGTTPAVAAGGAGAGADDGAGGGQGGRGGKGGKDGKGGKGGDKGGKDGKGGKGERGKGDQQGKGERGKGSPPGKGPPGGKDGGGRGFDQKGQGNQDRQGNQKGPENNGPKGPQPRPK
jgi:prepilin-type N-terminal cleavage/methylation domain-containing protein